MLQPLHLIFALTTAQLHLPQGLLEAICTTESQLNVNAIREHDGTSRSIGICQIKLTTAEWLGYAGSEKGLMDTELNILYAGKYLKYQLLRYNGNTVNAIIGYNQGSIRTAKETQYSKHVMEVWNSEEKRTYHWSEKEQKNFRDMLESPIIKSESQGIKYDQEKPDYSLLSTIAMDKMVAVLTYGKVKYTAHNWKKGFQYSRLLAATLRHVFAYLGGESLDPETGLSHLAHASCCLHFLLELETTRPDLDDRYKKEKK